MSETMQPGPDESQFKAMEVVAAASGPEAEARRQEMAQWSELQGRMAETAVSQVASVERTALSSNLNHEEVEQALTTVNKNTAERGVGIYSQQAGSQILKPVEQGILVKNSEFREGEIVRSPAHINEAPNSGQSSEQKVA